MIERISLITSFIGVIALLVLSQFIEPRTVQIRDIDERMIGQTISVYGNITSIRILDNMELLTLKSLEDESEITIVVFGKAEIANGIVNIKGKVKEYHNQLEIEATEIRME